MVSGKGRQTRTQTWTRQNKEKVVTSLTKAFEVIQKVNWSLLHISSWGVFNLKIVFKLDGPLRGQRLFLPFFC